jgi:hypothetical protein
LITLLGLINQVVFYLHIYFVQHFIVKFKKIKFKIGMRTKVAVSPVIDGDRKLVEVEVELTTQITRQA